jgi:hypothetical protein
MATGVTNRRHPIRRWRDKRAAKAARTRDTPEKLAERRKVADPPDVKDAATRAGTIFGTFW